jgi:hypothetical protein
MKGKPSASKYQESSVFVDDSSEVAKQEITDVVYYCLHLLQKGKYITDYVS